MTNKRKEITETIKRDYCFTDYDLDELVKLLQKVKEEYKEQYYKFTFEYPLYESIYIDIIGHRLETDEEYEKRLNKEKIKKEENKERELKLLKELKEKYEK